MDNSNISTNNISKTNKSEIKKETIVYDKESIQEYNKQFFQKNKDRKYHCDLCNCEVSFFNKSHHKKSKKHQLLLEKESRSTILDEKDQNIKILEDKEKYIKLLEEKEIYIQKLKEREQSIQEFELKFIKS